MPDAPARPAAPAYHPGRAAAPAGASGGPRSILVDPQIYDLLNMGGVAMVQSLAARLRGRWPDAELQLLTERPEAVEALLPGAVPVPYAHLRRWTADRYLLGPVFRALPDRAARRVIALQRDAERRLPGLAHGLTRARVRLAGTDWPDYRAYEAALARAELVVLSGGQGFSDAFPATFRGTVATLERARARGLPTVLVSQGAGVIDAPAFRRRLRHALAGVAQVHVREGDDAPGAFAGYGVPAERLVFGGDDAIPLARAARAPGLGAGLGLNLRVAAYAGTDDALLARVRAGVGAFLAEVAAPLVALPIAVHERSPDHAAIRALAADHPALAADAADGGAGVRRPAEVVAAAGRCRVAVAGAYHAGVFALAQGVPTVLVAGSPLYAGKLGALAAQFGDGCVVLGADDPELPGRLAAALRDLWARADALHPRLRAAADRLAAANDAAYDRLFACVEDALAARRAGARRGGERR